MTFQDQLDKDETVFFNGNEFSLSAKWRETTFLVNRNDDYEVDDTQHEHFTAKTKDIEGLEIGNVVEIEGRAYTIFEISDIKESYGLEQRLIMALENEY